MPLTPAYIAATLDATEGPLGSPDRSALEALWRHRLKDARLRLDRARNHYREIKQDFASRDASAPVEYYAIQQALRAEVAALVEFSRVQAIFNDLTLNGNPPPDDEPRHDGK